MLRSGLITRLLQYGGRQTVRDPVECPQEQVPQAIPQPGGVLMLPLVEIPEIVRHYAPFFTSVFSPEAFKQFQRYISGLIVSENKTVEGINRIFVIDVRNQSSLNRLLTESPFSVDALNRAR